MRQYHAIMKIVWIVTSIGIVVASTWMGFKDGFDKWWMMYLFAVLTTVQYYRHRVQLRKLSEMQNPQEKKEA